jgi:hypothetical protein
MLRTLPEQAPDVDFEAIAQQLAQRGDRQDD